MRWMPIPIDIAKHPFAIELQGLDSSDEVFRLFEAKAKGLKDYRGGKLSDFLLVIRSWYGSYSSAVSARKDDPRCSLGPPHKSLAEKRFGSGEIGAVMQGLNRPTQDEARMTVDHIPEAAIGDEESSLSVIRPALGLFGLWFPVQEMVDAVNNVTRVGIIRLQRN
ncbi:hypothetical protein EDB87DRAFT_1703620 [Lactarius vividus]|nr:hypothetical protein EDB87DRAFT_1703620 [Lactarius vividus]